MARSNATGTPSKDKGKGGLAPLSLIFSDNHILPSLFGEQDSHLRRIEQDLGVTIASRGNQLAIEGRPESQLTTKQILESLYNRLAKGQMVTMADVETALRMSRPSDNKPSRGQVAIRTKRKVIEPQSPTQVSYIQALQSAELVFGIGPAGTGKTYLAVASAVESLLNGAVSRLILSRPAVEAGERLGFLPGDLRDKIDPYLRPLFDALYDMLPPDQITRRLESGEIEIAPLAFMRGRTLANSVIILDEAQNTTPSQMKMFLTRLGENSRMIITGDPSQIDLPNGTQSGLHDALDAIGQSDRLQSPKSHMANQIRIIRFEAGDIVRHRLVTEIVMAYEERDAARQGRQG
ncbi:MAG: PhoH family protein [Candidatus Pacebacteria bacterium]|nr:PhoH family protein [Candidatus Paceibacterota bacterium]